MNRKILLGVTGSIAAYKAVELVRLFVKNGDSMQVVMTEAATKFVTPLTFQTLSRNPVFVDAFAPIAAWKPEHVSLAEAADVALVAPATANTLAKMRWGLADNLLTETLLATRAPVFVAGSKPLSRFEQSGWMRSSSRRTRMMLRGHLRAHAPQPMHLSSLTSAQPNSFKRMASKRQAFTHASQPIQP